MARRLFGTDGVRGVAGEFLTADLAMALARAATQRVGRTLDRPVRALVIRDTRESGDMLEAAVAAGIASAGGEALIGGVVPTPAAPLLIARYELDLAVVLSASHNPFADNGVKFFGADGDKLSDEVEEEIEQMLGEPEPTVTVGRVRRLNGTLEDYLRELHTRFESLDLTALDVVLDCANGSTYQAGPEIFRRLGANPIVLYDAPDGRNINEDCGSTHLEAIREAVTSGGHTAGFAFDGDGDRVLAVDGTGAVVDGDELIALATLHLKEQGRLTGDGVAVTVMTNHGFQLAMDDAGVEVSRTKVGDRYVLEELRRRGWTLGGEQSGHIIELGFAPSGDGIASALLTLEALAGRPLAERGGMRKLPQRLVNVRVTDRAVIKAPEIKEAVERETQGLEGRGRVLVRPSGTEPLVRVMVEAPTEDEADAVCARLVEVVEQAA